MVNNSAPIIKSVENMNVGNISIGLLSISISVMYLTYIHHLEKSKCACSLNWRQQFIKYAIMVMIGLTLLSIAMPKLMTNNLYIGCHVVFSVTYLVILGQWLWKLHRSQCKCSDDWRKTIMEVLYIIMVSIIILICLYMVSIKVITAKK
jgi:hypothetical protein